MFPVEATKPIGRFDRPAWGSFLCGRDVRTYPKESQGQVWGLWHPLSTVQILNQFLKSPGFQSKQKTHGLLPLFRTKTSLSTLSIPRIPAPVRCNANSAVDRPRAAAKRRCSGRTRRPSRWTWRSSGTSKAAKRRSGLKRKRFLEEEKGMMLMSKRKVTRGERGK